VKVCRTAPASLILQVHHQATRCSRMRWSDGYIWSRPILKGEEAKKFTIQSTIQSRKKTTKKAALWVQFWQRMPKPKSDHKCCILK
jgi:hypothetical protein